MTVQIGFKLREKEKEDVSGFYCTGFAALFLHFLPVWFSWDGNELQSRSLWLAQVALNHNEDKSVTNNIKSVGNNILIMFSISLEGRHESI